MAIIVSGMMNKQIAAKLDVAEITVKVHRASLIRKMDANPRRAHAPGGHVVAAKDLGFGR